jgi:formylglycine-generating enzyme required for sulfatase activity
MVIGYMVWNQQRVEVEGREKALSELLEQAKEASSAADYTKAEGYIFRAAAMGLHPERVAEVKRGVTQQEEEAKARTALQAAQAKQEREERELKQQQEELKRQREDLAAAALQKQQAEEAAAQAKAKAAAAEDLGIKMVSVQGGNFSMGCGVWTSDCYDDEKPVHEVRVGDFRIGKYEVTQGQWRAVMGNNPSFFSSCGDNCPVERVSWDEVQTFLGKLQAKSGKGYRLPTEAEWEYACRSGGKAEKYCGGSDVERLAWYAGNSGNQTHAVGTKAANGLGLCDMSGNVREWCSDRYGAYGSSPQKDPTGSSSGSYRVIRGGSWGGGPADVRSANRFRHEPASWLGNLGFRLVLPPGQ